MFARELYNDIIVESREIKNVIRDICVLKYTR